MISYGFIHKSSNQWIIGLRSGDNGGCILFEPLFRVLERIVAVPVVLLGHSAMWSNIHTWCGPIGGTFKSAS